MTVATPLPHHESNRPEREQPLRPRKPDPTLGDLIRPTGMTAADLAFLTGVQESTVSRLWNDSEWSDRVTGRTFKAIAGVVPSIADHLACDAVTRRLHTHTQDIEHHGLTINHTALDDAVQEGTPVEHLATALRAAAKILDGDTRAATGHLARSFGRDQDQALAHLFDGLLTDPTPLLDAATALAEKLRGSRSPHAFMSIATIRHHVARTTGQLADPSQNLNGNQAAFMRRSSAIGLILATDDHDLVDRYAQDVTQSSLAARIELWSMVVYNRDARPTPDFWLPKGVILTRTADEVLRELAGYNNAYAIYLAAVFLPSALELDPTFGGRRPDLATALLDRRATINDKRTSAHIDQLLERIT
jgi:hypothetical protein